MSQIPWKRLCLENYVFGHRLKNCRVHNSDVVTMAEKCPLLQTVERLDCPSVGPTALSALAKLPNLKELSCCSCRGSRWDLKNEIQPSGEGSNASCLVQPNTSSNLRRLTVNFRGLATDSGLWAFTSLVPNLVCLHVDKEFPVADGTLHAILSNCVLLQELRLDFTTTFSELDLTSVSLRHIREQGRALRSVVFPKCSVSVTVLARTFLVSPKLVDLYIHHTHTPEYPAGSEPSLGTDIRGVISDVQWAEGAVDRRVVTIYTPRRGRPFFAFVERARSWSPLLVPATHCKVLVT